MTLTLCTTTGRNCMAYSRGDVVLVPLPYSDLTSAKTRPAVIVSSDIYHNQQPDILLCALTTNLLAASDSLDYILQDWTAANLRFPTAFKPVIVTLDPALIVHYIGRLTLPDLEEIDTRLRSALGL